MKYEFNRVRHTKRSLFFIGLIILIPMLDLLMNVQSTFGDYWRYPAAYHYHLASRNVLHPAMAGFLSGSSIGHFGQMLYMWILPLYSLLIYSDFYIQEKKLGLNNAILTRVAKKRLVMTRLNASFVLMSGITLISLLLNYFLAIIIFHGGTSFQGLEQTVKGAHRLFVISMAHPYAAYLIYLVVFAVMAGFYAVFCTSLSFLLAQYRWVYPLALLIWIGQFILPNSLSYVFQPFIEYGWSRIIPALALFFVLVIGTALGTYLHWSRADEI